VPPFERSVQLDPRNATFRYHLGLAYLKAGDRPRGRTALQEALKMAPEASDAAEARQTLASLKEPGLKG
jgi:Flp pilus assembly protein TadD